MASNRPGLVALCLLTCMAAVAGDSQSQEPESHPAVVQGPMDGEDGWTLPARG